MSNGRGGLPVYIPFTDYLDPQINRPDLFEERVEPREGLHVGKNGHKQNFMKTLALVLISAFIFISIVGWASLLQSFLDYKIIDPIIKNVAISRLWYAIIVTLVAIILIITMWFLFFHKL